jgi:hypothetical protein
MSAAVSESASVAKYKAEESITETRINRVLNFLSHTFFNINLIIILKANLPVPFQGGVKPPPHRDQILINDY